MARRTDWTGRDLWDGGGRAEGLCLFMMVEVGGGSERRRLFIGDAVRFPC